MLKLGSDLRQSSCWSSMTLFPIKRLVLLPTVPGQRRYLIGRCFQAPALRAVTEAFLQHEAECTTALSRALKLSETTVLNLTYLRSCNGVLSELGQFFGQRYEIPHVDHIISRQVIRRSELDRAQDNETAHRVLPRGLEEWTHHTWTAVGPSFSIRHLDGCLSSRRSSEDNCTITAGVAELRTRLTDSDIENIPQQSVFTKIRSCSHTVNRVIRIYICFVKC